jgi:AcrR family transcriptional regulator
MATKETRRKILDTAERLFAERGFADTSLREITSAAGVNLAAVHYHYASKEALLQAVFARRMEPLNRIRMAMLDACAARAAPSLEDVLDAIVGPVLDVRVREDLGGERFARLLGRSMFEPEKALLPVLYREFKDVFLRFTDLLQQVLPGAPPEEIFWRVHFLAGALSFNMVNARQLRTTSGGLCDPADVARARRELVAFAAGGFRASGAG